MDLRSDVNRVVAAFNLGIEIAEGVKNGLYDELEVDDLGALIAALITQKVLGLEDN